mmetsp:Transcript_5951/g.11154  ORF Transcript_5951/g.11154 Transcript_5951/m.11154 type:complete len:247 (+) Transcript_5951:408-1148(+)
MPKRSRPRSPQPSTETGLLRSAVLRLCLPPAPQPEARWDEAATTHRARRPAPKEPLKVLRRFAAQWSHGWRPEGTSQRQCGRRSPQSRASWQRSRPPPASCPSPPRGGGRGLQLHRQLRCPSGSPRRAQVRQERTKPERALPGELRRSLWPNRPTSCRKACWPFFLFPRRYPRPVLATQRPTRLRASRLSCNSYFRGCLPSPVGDTPRMGSWPEPPCQRHAPGSWFREVVLNTNPHQAAASHHEAA